MLMNMRDYLTLHLYYFILKYKRRWIYVIFLQNKYNINAVFKNIQFMCIHSGYNWGKAR
jgi:hypothetical protein